MSILSIKNVTKKYASAIAVDNLSLEIPRQSILGLLGPNGAGKTSLIRLITMITAPDSGEILFEGRPLSADHIKNIGYLPEERGLYRKMEVGEQAVYLAQLKGFSRHDAIQKLKYWFEKFEMISWWNKKVEELSKGMQQKVQFVVTVVHEPQLLILDEPFTGFDPINAELIKNELLALNKKGTSIVLSTHRMESVEELCTHIALINKGRLILDGSIRDIRKQYKSNTYEINYIGNKIGFANALWTGFQLLDLTEVPEHSVAKVKMLNNHTPNDLLNVLLPHVQITGLKEIIPNINDIFIERVSESRNEEVVA